jgi:glycerol-3-phosphate acyltransferase PlsY
MTDFLLLCVSGYLIGSIPFGLLLTRLAGLGDLRQIGSGNIGATNVLRTGNKGLAVATLVLDGGKGALVVGWAAAYAHGGLAVAPFCAFLGHLYPVWLGFRGGKGVATGLGILLAVNVPAGLVACGVWLAVAFLLRFSSAAALAAFAVAPFAMFYFTGWHFATLALLMSGLVFWKHRGNIVRLRAGTEPRIGRSQKAAHG